MLYILIGLVGSAVIVTFLGLIICLKRDQKNYTPVTYSVHPFVKQMDTRLSYQNYHAQPYTVLPPSYSSVMENKQKCRDIPPNQPRLVIPKTVITT